MASFFRAVINETMNPRQADSGEERRHEKSDEGRNRHGQCSRIQYVYP